MKDMGENEKTYSTTDRREERVKCVRYLARRKGFQSRLLDKIQTEIKIRTNLEVLPTFTFNSILGLAERSINNKGTIHP
jgi:hypothetical protein